MSSSPVTFYMPELTDRDAFERADPDSDPHLFGQASHMTVGQTYIRLRDAGLPVRLATAAPAAGTTVLHAPNMGSFLEASPRSRDVTIVCVEADRRLPQNLLADVILRHNGSGVDGRRRVFMPNWIQCGLIPRDASRRDRIEHLTYKGRAEHLHPAFHSGEWPRLLETEGVTFTIAGPGELAEGRTYTSDSMRWHDYSEDDVLLAVRPDLNRRYREKPAVKLINAWAAGVPALLGPEYAYREMRRSQLDYFEVTSPSEAIRAVRRLLREPGLYTDMVENGRRRAQIFSVEHTTQRWAELLFEVVPRLRVNPALRALRPLLVPVRRVKQRLAGR